MPTQITILNELSQLHTKRIDNLKILYLAQKV